LAHDYYILLTLVTSLSLTEQANDILEKKLRKNRSSEIIIKSIHQIQKVTLFHVMLSLGGGYWRSAWSKQKIT